MLLKLASKFAALVDDLSQRWIVHHKYDNFTIGFPMSKEKAQWTADSRNRVAVLGAWGKSNPDLDPPYEIVPYQPIDRLSN